MAACLPWGGRVGPETTRGWPSTFSPEWLLPLRVGFYPAAGKAQLKLQIS